jgi:hypothetical protein
MAAQPDGEVLLVEDDDSMRGSIERSLGEARFACAAFASGDALLRRGVVEHSLCAVSDLRLPGGPACNIDLTCRFFLSRKLGFRHGKAHLRSPVTGVAPETASLICAVR